MKWEIRMDGRRYRLRNRGLFTFCIVVLALLVVGIAFVVIGMAASRSERVHAPAATASAAPRAGALGSSMRLVEVGAGPGGGDAPDINPSGDWRLTLVNEKHPLPEGFTVQTCELPNGLEFDARAYDDLAAMMRDGMQQGVSLVVCSAYRTIQKQQELYDSKVSRLQREEGKSYDEAYREARNTVALPGASEHNLGLAADIVAMSYQQLDEGYLNTKECKWLADNAYKYGFIMRYPQEKSEITKIIFEPWHYRYVGKEAAREMVEKGVCLEEYLGTTDDTRKTMPGMRPFVPIFYFKSACRLV